jgi:outer membrane immunogenic protein
LRRITSVIVAAFGLLAAPALAADMAVKSLPQAAAPAIDWNGFYVGLEGGGGFGSTSHAFAAAPSSANSGGSSNLKGGLFGGTYGYNFQSGHLVAGFEGDFSWSGISDTFVAASATPTFCPPGFPCFTSLQWLGTDRVRLGYAFDRYLAYATGGVAYGNVLATILNAGPTGIDSEIHTRVGYTVGGGIEAMVAPNWSAKLEYLYTDFGTANGYTCVVCTPFPPTKELVFLNSNIVRLGVDYHFGGPVFAEH